VTTTLRFYSALASGGIVSGEFPENRNSTGNTYKRDSAESHCQAFMASPAGQQFLYLIYVFKCVFNYILVAQSQQLLTLRVDAMENLLTNKTASLTELRDPKKVIEKAGDKPVAILNRNQLEGYFVPAAAVEKISFSVADPEDVSNLLRKRRSKLKPTLEYLKDK
jgi:antitoxin StbD